MNTQQQIQAKITETYNDNSPNVYKGNDYDGTIQAYGWWYKPFNAQPIYLGSNLAEALETLEDIADSYAEVL